MQLNHNSYSILYHCKTHVTLFNFIISKDFWNRSKLTHSEPKFFCDLCEYKTFSEDRLNYHMQKHKGEEHRCDECDFVTFTAKLLQNHKSNNHMERPFKCDFCDHRVNREAELLDHIRHHHTMERPFKCDQCEMAFSSKIKLTRHKVRFSLIAFILNIGGCDLTCEWNFLNGPKIEETITSGSFAVEK